MREGLTQSVEVELGKQLLPAGITPELNSPVEIEKCLNISAPNCRIRIFPQFGLAFHAVYESVDEL